MSNRRLRLSALGLAVLGVVGAFFSPVSKWAEELFGKIPEDSKGFALLALVLAIASVIYFVSLWEKRRDQLDEDRNRTPEPGVRHILIALILKSIQQGFDRGLYGRAKREFRLTSHPLRITGPAGVAIQVPIDQYYRSVSGPLFIIGEPGVGKSTLLNELVTVLMPADRDEHSPVVVPFELNLWRPGKEPLEEWISEDLYRRFQIARRASARWLENHSILPMFDGLDEVPSSTRRAALKEIARFISNHPHCKTVVTCRRTEYNELCEFTSCFELVEIEPLTPDEVAIYLNRHPEHFAHLSAALTNDPRLRDLLTTPLLLWVAAFAFEDTPALVTIGQNGSPISILFDRYVQAMLQREDEKRGRTKEPGYGLTETNLWLAGIAKGMQNAGRLSFEMEDLSPSFLPPSSQSSGRAAVWLSQMILYVSAWMLLVRFLFPFLYGNETPIGWIWFWIFVISFLISCTDSNRPVDQLLYHLKASVVGVAIIGLLFAAMAFYLWTWMEAASFFAGIMVFGLALEGIERVSILERTSVYQGFFRSAQYSATILAVAAGLFVLFAEAADQVGVRAVLAAYVLQFSAMGTLVAARLYGGGFVVDHVLVRLLLWRNRILPLRGTTFLNFAVDRVIMTRQGASYRFIHRMLQEHLASKFV